jgi:hypothetical protein
MPNDQRQDAELAIRESHTHAMRREHYVRLQPMETVAGMDLRPANAEPKA